MSKGKVKIKKENSSTQFAMGYLTDILTGKQRCIKSILKMFGKDASEGWCVNAARGRNWLHSL